VGVFY